MEEIAYAVYYPTAKEKARSHGVHWVPRPLNTATAGWAKFAGKRSTIPGHENTLLTTFQVNHIGSSVRHSLTWPFVHLLARFIRLPAYEDAPLKPSKAPEVDQSSASSETLVGSSGKWPLVIFSHGKSSFRQQAWQVTYAVRFRTGRRTLRIQGMVVLAIEHRDGSGPIVTPIDEETGKLTPKLYIQAKELSWDNEPTTKLPIRKDQLVFRIREIYEAFASFKSTVNGNQDATVSMEPFNHWDSLKGQVDCSKVFLTGHSFGGATLLSLLSSPPPEGHSQLPIEKVVLLDPWLDPLPLPGTLPVAYGDRPPLLIMNSEGFTLWKEHFEMLEQLIADWRRQKDECATLTFTTPAISVRSKHHFYSDFALFVPFGETRRLGMSVLDSAHRLTTAYFNGTLANELKGKRGMEVEPIPGKDKYGEGKRQIVGQPGELIVH
ncbi:hypothetical protein FRC10_007025 [Ceratobasidium sp. 414]|nr:hypothetical protein FRC10_007025 [Ceratobasidium sp. 414]